MEIQNNMKKIIILTILILISLYIILGFNGEPTNQEPPKKATFVKNSIGVNDIYG